MNVKTVLTICVILFSFALVNAQWQSDYVAATDASEFRPNIDVNGNIVHIVYQKSFAGGKGKKNPSYRELFYCQFVNSMSSPVKITSVKKDLYKPAIAVNGNGDVHIAVMDGTNDQVLYLSNSSGSLNDDPIPVNESNSWGYLRAVEIGVDAYNKPHIIAIGGTNSDIVGFDNLYYATLGENGFEEQNLSFLLLPEGMQARDISIDVVGMYIHIGCRAEIIGDLFDSYNIYYIHNISGAFDMLPVYKEDFQYPDTFLRNARIAIDGTGAAHIVHVKSVYDPDKPGYTRYVLDAIYKESVFLVNEIFITDQTLFSVDAAAKGDSVAILMGETSQSEDLWLKMASLVPSSDPPDLVSTGPRLSYFWEKIAVDLSGNIHIVCRQRNESTDIIYFTNNLDYVGESSGGSGDMHVASIDVNTTAKGKNVNATVSVQIIAEDGSSVDRALISGVWSGLTNDSDEFSTGSDGFGAANSDRVNKREREEFIFTITNVVKSGWVYDVSSNIETSDFAPWNVMGKRIVTENTELIPITTDLIGNFPNPFNPSTTIKFQISENQNVKLQIYNLMGKLIKTLVDSEQNVGNHSVIWNGKDDFGQNVASGLYIYKLQAGSFVKMYKLNLLKYLLFIEIPALL